MIVPNERVEALVRALLASFSASGGVPLRVVFDHPTTVVLRRDAGRPVWNATLAQAMLDCGCGIELCTSRSPEQKGSVEHLVGFVKRAFVAARRFQDLTTDLPQQLTEWLVYANTVRPSRATGVTPHTRLVELGPVETLTLHRLNVFREVGVSFRPTSLIERVMARFAVKTRRVTRWTTSDQKLRWCASARCAMETQFRRVKQYRQLPWLNRALQHTVSSTTSAAA